MSLVAVSGRIVPVLTHLREHKQFRIILQELESESTMEYDAVSLGLYLPTFRRIVLPLSA